MSTATKTAALLAALLLVVGILVVPPYLASMVKLLRLPVVRGRVISADGHLPVAGVRAQVMLRESLGSDTMSGLRIQNDGRFSFAVEPMNPGVRLTLTRAIRRGGRRSPQATEGVRSARACPAVLAEA
jgi:hypothetical protein